MLNVLKYDLKIPVGLKLAKKKGETNIRFKENKKNHGKLPQ
jgi:hypothetical protein